LNNDEAMERDASNFATCDVILHYVKTFEEGNGWVILPHLNTFGQNTLINFTSPPIGLRTNI